MSSDLNSDSYVFIFWCLHWCTWHHVLYNRASEKSEKRGKHKYRNLFFVKTIRTSPSLADNSVFVILRSCSVGPLIKNKWRNMTQMREATILRASCSCKLSNKSSLLWSITHGNKFENSRNGTMNAAMFFQWLIDPLFAVWTRWLVFLKEKPPGVQGRTIDRQKASDPGKCSLLHSDKQVARCQSFVHDGADGSLSLPAPQGLHSGRVSRWLTVELRALWSFRDFAL